MSRLDDVEVFSWAFFLVLSMFLVVFSAQMHQTILQYLHRRIVSVKAWIAVVGVTAMFVIVFVVVFEAIVVTNVAVFVVVVVTTVVVFVATVVTNVVVVVVGLVLRPLQLGNIVSLFVFRVPT